MMTKTIRTFLSGFLALSFLATAQSLCAQALVDLRILPDTNAPIYTQADIGVLDRFNPQPLVTKDFIGQGWETILYRGNYTGYVRNGTLAGEYVRPDTKIYMGPTEDSPLMQTLQSARQAKFEERVNSEWSKVTFNGVIPLYFMRNNSPQMQGSATAGNSSAFERDISRTYIGKLERVGSLSRLFGGNYEYQLVDANDKTVAYVDLSNALFVGRVENYWNKWVSIEGVSRQRAGSVPLVIEARFLSAR